MKKTYLLGTKTIFVSLVLTCLFVLSCSKNDEPTTIDLLGTTWKSNKLGTAVDSYYEKLSFTANSAYYEYELLQGSTDYEMVGAGFYALDGNKITLSSTSVYTGTINGNTINIAIDRLRQKRKWETL